MFIIYTPVLSHALGAGRTVSGERQTHKEAAFTPPLPGRQCHSSRERRAAAWGFGELRFEGQIGVCSVTGGDSARSPVGPGAGQPHAPRRGILIYSVQQPKEVSEGDRGKDLGTDCDAVAFLCRERGGRVLRPDCNPSPPSALHSLRAALAAQVARQVARR